MSRMILCAAAFFLFAVNTSALGRDDPKISRAALEEMFDHIRQKTTWNIDGRCLWGFFFTDRDPAKLRKAATALQNQGYRYVGILKPGPQDDDQTLLFLHVERTESHSVESLLIRNDKLYAFAKKHGLESYDGMDVGPAPTGDCSANQ